MSTSRLWVHVISGSLLEADSSPVFVLLRVGQTNEQTAKLNPPDPKWDHTFSFEIEDDAIHGSLILELYKSKFLFLTERLGFTEIPLWSICHSNKAGSGIWYDILSSSSNGSEVLTRNQLRLDVHFELPHADLPADVLELLDQKLRKLDEVLRNEVEILELQNHKIITGELAPPTDLAYVPSFPFNEPSPSASCDSLLSDDYSSHHSTQQHTPVISRVLQQLPSSVDQKENYDDDIIGIDGTYFQGFDWQREDEFSSKPNSSVHHSLSPRHSSSPHHSSSPRHSLSPRHGHKTQDHVQRGASVNHGHTDPVKTSPHRLSTSPRHGQTHTVHRPATVDYGHTSPVKRSQPRQIQSPHRGTQHHIQRATEVDYDNNPVNMSPQNSVGKERIRVSPPQAENRSQTLDRHQTGSQTLDRHLYGSQTFDLPRSQTVGRAPGRKLGHRRGSSLDNILAHHGSLSVSYLEKGVKTQDSRGLSPLIHSRQHSRSRSMTGVVMVPDTDNGAAAVETRRTGLESMDVTDGPGSRDTNRPVQQKQLLTKRKVSLSVQRWKKAYDMQLPEIRRRLTTKKTSFAGLSGNGAITLVQLVDQLQMYKKMGERKEEPVESSNYFSALNTEFRSRSRSVIDVKRKKRTKKHFIDEDARMHVYKRTVEALIYPASEPDNHKFEVWSAHKPTNCSECSALLWGLHNQGVKCTRCGKICHERCSTLTSQDCFIQDQFAAITDKMHRMEVNHGNRFQLLKEAFNIPLAEHEKVIRDTKQNILDMAQNFSAQVTVNVIASQGLVLKESDHKIYVSVTIGSQKKRTKGFRREVDDKTAPFWNEEFSFICYNYHEPIQIRVWNERDSTISRLTHRLTKEGDSFLGEKIIEVRRVGPPQDVWYKLGKRTLKGSEVSGHIKLNISAKVEGEVTTFPFHKQYMKLHEQLFLHCHLNNNEQLVPIPERPPDDDSVSIRFLPTVSQEAIDEFALRYAIEPIFRMMVHVELLVNHHSLKGALSTVDSLLKNLKFKMFMCVAADHVLRGVGASILMEEYMDASNFGRDTFSSLLDKLLTSLKLDLQEYREFYPCNDEQRLAELVDTCQLMETVQEFQQQVMGIASYSRLGHLILENMKECLKSTFDFIVHSSMTEQNTNDHPGLSKTGAPFEFFYNVLKQMKSVIREDRDFYAPKIARFCSFNLGDVSAAELWKWFSDTINGLFDTPANLEIFSPKEYINLFFSVKGLYESEVRRVPSFKDLTPDYPRWFLPCGKVWLLRYQKDGITFVDNAWEDDKNTFHFASHESQKFTSSSYQMFFYLHHGYEFIKGLGQEDEEVYMLYLEVFAQVICAVVQHYVDKVALHIPEYISELETVCMFLNNFHSLRVNVQMLYSQMGGENAGPGASHTLQDFQSGVLTKELSSWCVFVARSLTPSILKELGNLQTELLKAKSRQGSVEKNEVKFTVRPFLDMLTEKARVIANTCEQQVMLKVMKEVWYVCLESLHRMLLPMLKWEHEGGDIVPYQFPSTHYTHRQCTVLEMAMDYVKSFFTVAGKQGVKIATIERGVNQLKGVISLYKETTEMLVTDFIHEETSSRTKPVEASCGDLYIEVDAYSHPTTGELEGHIRVVSASSLSMSGLPTQGLKPYIELHLISPTAYSGNKRVFSTHSKNWAETISFNENFKFTLANWENSELQVVAKDHSKFRQDRTIGVAVFPFLSIVKEASLTLGLYPSHTLSDRGQAILNVLTVRTYDNFAKDFVALKSFYQKASSENLESDLN